MRWLVAGVVAVAVLVAAAPAEALNCAQFKTAVESATNGQTITLDAGLTCNATYVLPANKNAPFAITIQGGGAGATLDGTGQPTRIMTGLPTGNHVLDVTIRNLTFRNGSDPGGGGALLLSGKVGVTLDHDRFFGNKSTSSAAGGAVSIGSSGTKTTEVRDSTFGSKAAPNTAYQSGAINVNNGVDGPSIALVRDRFAYNTAQFGGVGYLSAYDASQTIRVADTTVTHNSADKGLAGLAVGNTDVVLERNAFVANRVHPTATTDTGTQGAALFLNGAGTSATVTQHDNRFRGNAITTSPAADFSASGAGEWIGGYPVTSRHDRFVGNTLPAPKGTGEAEGAGLGIEGCSNVTSTPVRLEGLVAAANKGGAGTHGAGVYVGGCSIGAVDLTVVNSTIAGNSTSGTGAVAGLAGGADDKLTLRNSIVRGSLGAAALGGFGAGRTVRSSDVCGPGVLPGAGNICAKPRLKDPAHGNVHETSRSPTIDRGANVFVPGALTTDIDGNARIRGARVDMGADEYVDPFTGVRIPAQAVTVKNGVAKVLVGCPAGVPGPCTGDLALSRKHNGTTTSFGHRGFSIAAGQQATVAVTLTAQGRTQLQQAGTLTVTAKATATDRLGKTATTSRQITLKS